MTYAEFAEAVGDRHCNRIDRDNGNTASYGIDRLFSIVQAQVIEPDIALNELLDGRTFETSFSYYTITDNPL